MQARRENQAACAHGAPAPCLGVELRCALIEASIHSLAGNLLPKLLAALVKEAVWTPAQGLSYARQIADPRGRAAALAALALHLAELERATLYPLWAETLPVLAARPRRHLLRDLRALTPLICLSRWGAGCCRNLHGYSRGRELVAVGGARCCCDHLPERIAFEIALGEQTRAAGRLPGAILHLSRVPAAYPPPRPCACGFSHSHGRSAACPAMRECLGGIIC